MSEAREGGEMLRSMLCISWLSACTPFCLNLRQEVFKAEVWIPFVPKMDSSHLWSQRESVWSRFRIKFNHCLSWVHCHTCSSLCHVGKTGAGLESALGSEYYLHCLVSVHPFLCWVNSNMEGIMESKGSIYLVSPLASPSQEVWSSAVTLHTQ